MLQALADLRKQGQYNSEVSLSVEMPHLEANIAVLVLFYRVVCDDIYQGTTIHVLHDDPNVTIDEVAPDEADNIWVL